VGGGRPVGGRRRRSGAVGSSLILLAVILTFAQRRRWRVEAKERDDHEHSRATDYWSHAVYRQAE
jgi:hypothetical protein